MAAGKVINVVFTTTWTRLVPSFIFCCVNPSTVVLCQHHVHQSASLVESCLHKGF